MRLLKIYIVSLVARCVLACLFRGMNFYWLICVFTVAPVMKLKLNIPGIKDLKLFSHHVVLIFFVVFFNILLWSINNFTKKSRKSISVSRSRSKKQTKDNPVRGFIRRKNYNTIVSSLVWIKLYSVETNGSVRTVLNEKQLHTLRTCYQANPRPDALMKEQLVEMTGLSPRVIRVWFQNKR